MEEGLVAVPASTLTQTITYMQVKEVTLRSEEGSLVIDSAGSETHIKTVPHEEFPHIPKIEVKGQVINREMFALGIKTASFAASVSCILSKASLASCRNQEPSIRALIRTRFFPEMLS